MRHIPHPLSPGAASSTYTHHFLQGNPLQKLPRVWHLWTIDGVNSESHVTTFLLKIFGRFFGVVCLTALGI